MTTTDKRLNNPLVSTRHAARKAIPETTKIFIAGASGMVGSAIIRKLLSLGHANLIGSYHYRKPIGRIFTDKGDEEDLPDGLRLVQLDLTQQSQVTHFFSEEKPAYVFLAAAKVGGIHANNTYPAQFIYENLAIQTHIIHAAYLSGVERLLFLGSSCIYPKLTPQPMKEEHLLTGLLEPTNEPYAIAKIAGIKMCEAYNRQYGTHLVAVMPTNLYGPNDNFDLESSHVLPALIRKFHLAKLAAEGDLAGIQKDEARFGPIPPDIKTSLGLTQSSAPDPQPSSVTETIQPSAPGIQPATVPIWGTGSPRREFLHVDDMADACVHIMNTDNDTLSKELLSYPKPCFVNLGTGVDYTIRELTEIVRNTVGFNGRMVFDASNPDGTPRKLLDVSQMCGLGWRASIGLPEGIQQTYQWYLNATRKVP